MKLQEAQNYLKSLKAKASSKSESMVYERFINLISSLQQKGLAKVEIQSIEVQLDGLKSNSKNRKKQIKSVYSKLINYLAETYSLTTAQHYTNLGIGFGSSFGGVFGIIIGDYFERSMGISIGISIGLLLGFFIGRFMDNQAKLAGNVL